MRRRIGVVVTCAAVLVGACGDSPRRVMSRADPPQSSTSSVVTTTTTTVPGDADAAARCLAAEHAGVPDEHLVAAFSSSAGVLAEWEEMRGGTNGPDVLRSRWRDEPADAVVAVCYFDAADYPVPAPARTDGSEPPPHNRARVVVDPAGREWPDAVGYHDVQGYSEMAIVRPWAAPVGRPLSAPRSIAGGNATFDPPPADAHPRVDGEHIWARYLAGPPFLSFDADTVEEPDVELALYTSSMGHITQGNCAPEFPCGPVERFHVRQLAWVVTFHHVFCVSSGGPPGLPGDPPTTAAARPVAEPCRATSILDDAGNRIGDYEDSE